MTPKEAYSRVVIDRKLSEAGWNLESEREVIFEDHGSAGRADYVLKDRQGHSVALIEAKSPEIDPYSAKSQAENYVKAQYPSVRFIYLANDKQTYFWDLDQGDAAPTNAFMPQAELERRKLQKETGQLTALSSEAVAEDYFVDVSPETKLREYQIKAWEAIVGEYESGRRGFLLEMATGTGKTVLASLVISKFLRTHQAQQMLFIVDRITLATQSKAAFDKYLHGIASVATYWGGNKKDVTGANVVVATIQSLQTHGREDFQPGQFDLVIHDEAHRSIYSPEARNILDYLQTITKIGLTATPKDFLKNLDIAKLTEDDPRKRELRIQRDTYRYFGCEESTATFRYGIQDGVSDGFLVPPQLHKMNSEITQEALSEAGLIGEGEYEEETYQIKDLEKKVSIPGRNELMMREFLEYAERTPSKKIGKTIVFAVSQNHALALEKQLNKLKPEFNGRFALTITSRVERSADLAREFKKASNDLPRVAVSVDMLTTGYDAPEVQNIVLARPVFEPTLYQQIKGRGTRLCPEIEKKQFVLFDFCGVCDYFDEEYDWEAPTKLPRVPSTGKAGGSTTGGAELPTIPEPQPEPVGDEMPVLARQDAVGEREQIAVGPKGDTVDRKLYQDKWKQAVRDAISNNPELGSMLKDESKVDEAIAYAKENLLDRPEEYFNEQTLSQAYRVVATLRDFIMSAAGKSKLPSQEEQLDRWRQGLIDKYAAKSGGKKASMIELIANEIVANKKLRKQLIEQPTTSFVTQDPFTAYELREWRTEIGKEQLRDIVSDIRESELIKVI